MAALAFRRRPAIFLECGPIGQNDTIFALASGRGRAGVAVVRVSGPAAGPALECLSGNLPHPREASLRTIVSRETREVLDRGLVLWMPAPASFTGEDVAELHLHGGPAVIAAVLGELAEQPGLRASEAGEFTRRAFHNGRLDLTQVEALADLIAAETDAQRRQAQRQMDGALSRAYEAWRADLIQCLAYQEAEIDFPDESDVPDDVAQGMRRSLERLIAEIAGALRDERRGERLRDGFQVVIAGRPNVGKSSLLNALARRDAAIVSETAGTTRDVIEVHLDLAGYPVTLVDTAGLRDADDLVEREGVERARRHLGDADLVLWVSDAEDLKRGRPEDLDDTAPVCLVINKSDLGEAENARAAAGLDARVVLSAKTGAGMADLVAILAEAAETGLSAGEASVVTRARHRDALEDCRSHMVAAVQAWGGEPELVAEDLRLAARALGRVTGRVDVEDLLDVIFRDFCIGK